MEKWKQICGKIGKDRFVILIIGGLLLLVITYPLPSDTAKENTDGSTQDTTIENSLSEEGTASGSLQDAQEDSYQEEMESELAQILSSIEGAGAVKVYISFADYGVKVVEKDVSYTRNNEEETEGDARNTSTVTTENTEETIYTVNEAGDQVPFVNKITTPSVEGVLVAAQGGGNQGVAAEMKEAIMALFGIEEHKIKVVKMKGEEG